MFSGRWLTVSTSFKVISKILPHVLPDKIVVQPGRQHEGRVGAPGEDVIPPDLLGAFAQVGEGGDGDPPQVLDAAQVGDDPGQVLAAAVSGEAEFLEDGLLVL